MLSLIGYSGSILLSLCALPEAYYCWKNKTSSKASRGLLVMWSAGEMLTFLYILPKMDVPLLLNYSCNIVFLSIIWYYTLKDSAV